MSGRQLIHGRFDPQGVLSRDGFGEVLLAVDQKTGKSVSLRVLSNGEVGALVRRQVKALGTFQHPHVARSYGVVTSDTGTSYLVQSPMTGRHASDHAAAYRQAGRPVPLAEALKVMEGVCSALTALAATGPYGVLRPRSVWLLNDGRVHVTDVALVRAAFAAAGVAAFAPEEQGYVAPELKAGAAPSFATDTYGAALVLYELLTGRTPNEPFTAPSQVHPEVTPALEAELYRALSPDQAARHASPEALWAALQAALTPAERQQSQHASIDVEVSLHSVRPARREPQSAAPQSAAIEIEFEPDTFAEPEPRTSDPSVGARVSLHEQFRASPLDAAAASAAAERRSLGGVDLKGVLAKITEDDSPRWMVVKNGMDHGPFSGRQLVNMIIQHEAHPDHELMNTDTGRRGKVSEFDEFKEFLAQVEIRQFEADRAQKLIQADVKEKRGALFKLMVGGSILLTLGLAGGYYAYTRSQAARRGGGDADLDIYRRGDVEISGSAGILPMPKPGSRRSGGGGGGGGGGGMSYEDAMMQAVEMGNIGGGGEQQLSAGTVAGVMNKHLNQLYGACVHGNVGKVTVDIAITGSGKVAGVSVSGGSGDVQRCVADQVRRIQFPSFAAPRMGARYSFGS